MCLKNELKTLLKKFVLLTWSGLTDQVIKRAIEVGLGCVISRDDAFQLHNSAKTGLIEISKKFLKFIKIFIK